MTSKKLILYNYIYIYIWNSLEVKTFRGKTIIFQG